MSSSSSKHASLGRAGRIQPFIDPKLHTILSGKFAVERITKILFRLSNIKDVIVTHCQSSVNSVVFIINVNYFSKRSGIKMSCENLWKVCFLQMEDAFVL